jgi:hypothetical protein
MFGAFVIEAQPDGGPHLDTTGAPSIPTQLRDMST